jgi:hypothetical protein
MLEILFLVRFARHLSKLARSKGRSGGWAGLGVAFWIGGEILGLLVGGAADAGVGAYLVALLFAAFGATAAYFIVKSLRPMDPVMAYAGAPGDGHGLAPQGPPDLTNPYAPPRAQ